MVVGNRDDDEGDTLASLRNVAVGQLKNRWAFFTWDEGLAPDSTGRLPERPISGGPSAAPHPPTEWLRGGMSPLATGYRPAPDKSPPIAASASIGGATPAASARPELAPGISRVATGAGCRSRAPSRPGQQWR